VHYTQSFLDLPELAICFGQQDEKVGPSQLGPGGLPGGKAPVHLRDPLVSMPQLDQCPPPPEQALCRLVWKPMRLCERDQLLCLRLDGVPFSTELRQPSRMRQCVGQAKRVRQLTGEGEPLVSSVSGLAR
jgi:hypothetical protein